MWWYAPLNAATGERFQWLIFDQQGSVPVGYALFAFALGVLAGAITGRTLRAMAVTVVGFLVVRFAVAVWLRPHYLAALERKYPVMGSTEPNRLLGDWLIGGGGPGVGAVYDALGHKLKGGQMSARRPWPRRDRSGGTRGVQLRDLPAGAAVLGVPVDRDSDLRRAGDPPAPDNGVVGSADA